jgi:hypothetical protein
MILAFSNAGDAFSLDNLIRAFREDWRLTGFAPRLSAPWAQRWIQLQLAFVYFQAFFSKIPGKHWIDGWAVYFASRYDDCQRFMIPYVFDTPFVIKGLTWGTLVIEFALWTLVWFKEVKYWVLFAGILMHLGIDLTMNLPMFEWIMMVCYLSFVEPKDLTRAMNWLKKEIYTRWGSPVALAFDGNSMACIHTIGVLHRIDIFGYLDLIDFRQSVVEKEELKFEPMDNAIFLQTEKATLQGFAAFRWMSLRLPILWITVPFVFIPPFSLVSKHLFLYLSKRSDLIFGPRQDSELISAKS